MRLFVAIGFATHALLGPLCMAMPMEARASEPVHHSASHHEEHDDCPHCDHGQSDTSDCAEHCLSQAKNVSPVTITAFVGAPATTLPRSHDWSSVTAHHLLRPIGTAAPPLCVGNVATTVLLL